MQLLSPLLSASFGSSIPLLRQANSNPLTAASQSGTKLLCSGEGPRPLCAAGTKFESNKSQLLPRAAGDTERTRRRYNDALQKMERCFARNTRRIAIGFDPDQVRQQHQVSYLRDQVNGILEARRTTKISRNAVQRMFRAIIPLSKNFLLIGVQGQPVVLSLPRVLTNVVPNPLRSHFLRRSPFNFRKSLPTSD
jgi:hypothetical protein